MIFRDTHEEVLNGTKTQTRRLVKLEDSQQVHNATVQDVIRNGRLLWRVGRTYAIQAGRGTLSLGRIRLIAIREERLQDISAGDCIAEGLATDLREHDAVVHLRWQFQMLWDGIHILKGERWEDNPEVWVLEITHRPPTNK